MLCLYLARYLVRDATDLNAGSQIMVFGNEKPRVEVRGINDQQRIDKKKTRKRGVNSLVAYSLFVEVSIAYICFKYMALYVKKQKTPGVLDRAYYRTFVCF